MELCELLIYEIGTCNVDLLKRYFMGILDKASTLEFKEFVKICNAAYIVNPVWYIEWFKED